MVSFSLWDILRNLLLAGRWTVLLSLMAFVGGGVAGLLLLLLRLRAAGYCQPCCRVMCSCSRARRC